MQDSFVDFMLDQLQGLGAVHARSMFGGHGIYHGETFFAIVSEGRLYFKTGKENRPDYLAHGMQPFRPSEKQTLKNYYEVPVDILEDAEQLARWAEKATRVQSGE